jgi:TRAP-type C4-dicarboxylate transport system permease small subunit
VLRLIDRCFAALAGVATASLIVAIAMVAADIVIRKTFEKSLIGAVDVTELVLVISAFLSIPLVFMRRGHVAVEIATDPLPPRARHLFEGFGALLGGLLFLAIGWLSFRPATMSIEAGDVSQDLAIPLVWYWAPAIAGCFLAAFAGLVMAAHSVMLALRKDKP